jgi:subtilisin
MKNNRKNKKKGLFKIVLNKRTRLELLLIAILALTLTVALERSSRVSYLSNELNPGTADVAKPVETTIQAEKVAEKLDYSRKIITVKSGQVSAFKSKVISLGGNVTDQITENTFVVNLPKSNHEEIAKVLYTSGTVDNLEVDYPATITADKIDWGVERISAPKVWGTTTGSNVRVAVLDTGVDDGHPDLAGTVVGRYNFINDTSTAIDGHGHGTHVAGTVSALQNGGGMQGASYGSKILAGKVLADDGVGYLSDVVEGINWAVAQGARVINLSLGTTYNSKLLEDTVNQAASRGVIVIAAAGNTGGTMLYPAAYSSVLSVGATDSSNNLADFSARGAAVVAPGVGITSTLPGSRYASWSGTSMAAPHVSAAAALLMSAGEANVKEKLRTFATDLGDAGVDYKYGYGLINLESSMAAPDNLPPIVTITNPLNNSQHKNGKLELSAIATDESGISQVAFYLDGQLSNTFLTEPYKMSLMVNKLVPGPHVLLVRATDKKGNMGDAQIEFKVETSGNNPTKPSNTGATIEVDPATPTGTNLEQRVSPTNSRKNDTPSRKRSLLQTFLSALTPWQ